MSSSKWVGIVCVVVALTAIGVFVLLRPHNEPTKAVSGEPVNAGEALPTVPVESAFPPRVSSDSSPPAERTKLTQDQGDEAISDILADDTIAHEAAAKLLLDLIPQLPADLQAEAAEHIANLADRAVVSEYADLLKRNALPPPAAEVLYSELYNEEEDLFMPTVAGIADNPKHPYYEESAETLDILIGPLPQGVSWSVHAEKVLREEAQEAGSN